MSKGSHVRNDERSSQPKFKLNFNTEFLSKIRTSIDFKRFNFKDFDFRKLNPKVYIAAAAVLLCIILIAALSGHRSSASEMPKVNEEALESVLFYENNITLTENISFTSRAYNITLNDSGDEALYIKAYDTDLPYLTAISEKISGKNDALQKAERLARFMTPSFFENEEFSSECSGNEEYGRYVIDFAHVSDSDRISITVSAAGMLESYSVLRTENGIRIVSGEKQTPVYAYNVTADSMQYMRCDNLPADLPEVVYAPDMSLSSAAWKLILRDGKVFSTDGREILDGDYFAAPLSGFNALEPGKYIVQIPVTRNIATQPVKVICFSLTVPAGSPYMPYSPGEMHDIVKAEYTAFPEATPIYNAADLDWFRYQLMLGQPAPIDSCGYSLPAYFTREDGKILVAYPSEDSCPMVYAGNSCYTYDAENNEFFNHIFEIG